MSEDAGWTLSRRTVIKLPALTALSLGATSLGAAPSPDAPRPPPSRMRVTLTVNGVEAQCEVDTRTTLLDALREHLHLTGPKKGCDHGQCGACTVLLDGRRINACMTLAVMQQGRSVTTIEGLARGETLHPMQQAFLKHDGLQCGYCTPGQICSAVGMLTEWRAGMPSAATAPNVQVDGKGTPPAEEIRERMSGNLCRCSCYPNIVAAIEDAAGART